MTTAGKGSCGGESCTLPLIGKWKGKDWILLTAYQSLLLA